MLSLSSTQQALSLKGSVGKRHYLARLLICGGTRLLSEKCDSIHERENLELTLNDPAIKTKLKEILTDKEWDLLYLHVRNSWKFTSSANFDLGLILELLRTIHSLAPHVTGLRTMPHDFKFGEDLASIELYCSDIQRQHITYAHFNFLWKAISETFLRIAGGISPEKRSEWEISIDKLLQDPLDSPEGNEYVCQLYRQVSIRRLFVQMMAAGKRLNEQMFSVGK